MDIEKEREVFEAVPEIKQWINALKYGEKTGVYIAIDNDKHEGVASWVNGAWWVWQAKSQAVPEIQQSKQGEIDDLKARLKAVHESRADFVEYCRKMESGNFVIVDKTDLELAIDALKDASNNDDDSFAHRAKDLEKALKNG